MNYDVPKCNLWIKPVGELRRSDNRWFGGLHTKDLLEQGDWGGYFLYGTTVSGASLASTTVFTGEYVYLTAMDKPSVSYVLETHNKSDSLSLEAEIAKKRLG